MPKTFAYNQIFTFFNGIRFSFVVLISQKKDFDFLDKYLPLSPVYNSVKLATTWLLLSVVVATLRAAIKFLRQLCSLWENVDHVWPPMGMSHDHSVKKVTAASVAICWCNDQAMPVPWWTNIAKAAVTTLEGYAMMAKENWGRFAGITHKKSL